MPHPIVSTAPRCAAWLTGRVPVMASGVLPRNNLFLTRLSRPSAEYSGLDCRTFVRYNPPIGSGRITRFFLRLSSLCHAPYLSDASHPRNPNLPSWITEHRPRLLQGGSSRRAPASAEALPLSSGRLAAAAHPWTRYGALPIQTLSRFAAPISPETTPVATSF
jgi:hypothetical protein